MGRPQTYYRDDLEDMVAWVTELARPGARVLEIGSGDGEVVRRLRAAGLDATGVDPHAEAGPHVVAAGFENLDAGPFDVLFASVSLHHAHDPAASAAALRRLSRPGSVIAVREFDRALMDHAPTLGWWFHTRHALAAVGVREDDHDFPADFDVFAGHWRAKMAEHVHPWATVAATLADAGFVAEACTPGPYLFRWGLGELVRPVEEALIADRRIHAVGVRWQGRRP